MRIPKTWITPMCERIVDTLFREEMIIQDVEKKVLAAEVERILTEELLVEDRLNDEVRRMLGEHEGQIDRGGYDYRKLFDLTKHKLIRERGIIV
jgi:hypothetical protein